MIFPGQTIGILGGGQLGRMMILEGRKMGYRFIILDPALDSPAGQVADEQIVANFDDITAAKTLAEKSDLILYEFENVDPALVKELEQITAVPQGGDLLRVTRHRLHEKQAIEQAGVPVTPYLAVHDKSEIAVGFTKLSSPVVLKTTTGGYDGKGQWLLRTVDEIESLPDELFAAGDTYILEQFVTFEKELSVVVARSITGEIEVFPPTINLHRNHILHMSVAPAPIETQVSQQAIELGQRVAKALDVVGLIAVEMFLLSNGELFVNETAPRPHNSGHYTFDACTISQFEQIIRATIGLPLQPTTMHNQAIMVNLLGEHQPKFFALLDQLPRSANVHWYGKTEAKTGRKMGHITFVGDSIPRLIKEIEQIPIWTRLTSEEQIAIFGKGSGQQND